MSFTVENPLVYFIQMVVSCGALSLPHHSGSHHIGDSRRGKQSTHGDPKGFHEKWWIIAVFLAALIGQSLKNSLTDSQFFYKSRRMMPNVIRGKEVLVDLRDKNLDIRICSALFLSGQWNINGSGSWLHFGYCDDIVQLRLGWLKTLQHDLLCHLQNRPHPSTHHL